MSASSMLGTGGHGDRRWTWPIDVGEFDTTIALRGNEKHAIAELGSVNLRRLARHDAWAPGWSIIRRLLRPLDAVNAALDSPPTSHRLRAMGDAVAVILLRCADLGRAYWGWTTQEWTEVIGTDQVAFRHRAPGWADEAVRPYLAPQAYLLAGFTEFHRLGSFSRLTLAWRIFGRDRVQDQISRLRTVLAAWGYRLGNDDDQLLPTVAAQVFLLARSPHLEELSTPLFERIRDEQRLTNSRLNALHAMQRAVAELGFCAPPTRQTSQRSMRATDGAPAWEQWADRWHATSTLTARVRGNVRSQLLKVGRWAAADLPEASDPQAWTRTTCATWIAAVDRMNVGDHIQRTASLTGRIGQPLAAGSKAAQIAALRTFFRDCQEWEWLPRRFDPQRALATPRSIAALVGPNPQIIADDIWAKLLWAGLNLQAADLPQTKSGPFYPLALVRAVTLTWLFSGQRSDEIARLRVGCIRWQTGAASIDAIRAGAAAQDGVAEDGLAQDGPARDTVCLLDVPTHKTGTAFTKPVDPILGQALDAWAAVRPTQPALRDRRTGEQVDLLFAVRGRRISPAYINNTVIPMLARKAGVPAADVRGNITSHRARSTIASQLYNAKEPMTLFELQTWLGHRSPQSTQFYAKISPKTLTRAYTDAGYFTRNMRTIEVLIDRDVVEAGTAASGQPWQHYDLGHGYCSYTFFEQCPHRMACARCDFYTPKDSTKAQLLEARDNLQKMVTAIPLTDDERAAVDDGQAALDRLLDRLADIPTPAGPTPRQLDSPEGVRLLPIVEVHQPPSRATP